MPKLPKDCSARVIGAEARKLVHYIFPSEHWEYREQTGNDNGVDCTIELIEQEEWTNRKLEGQIKGTRNPNKMKSKRCFSLPLDVKTITYGLGSAIAFVLFYVDVESEEVYYLPIQDYFIANPALFDQLENNESKMSLHIPCDNLVSKNDFELQQIAKSTYVGGPSRHLRKVEYITVKLEEYKIGDSNANLQ